MPTLSGGKYARQHARAHSKLSKRGQTVSATKGSESISGVAIELPGEPEEYERLSLIKRSPKTLLFCADTYGDVLPTGALVTFLSVKYQIERKTPTASPDGIPIVVEIVIAT